jgi:hypothetical protein
METSSKSTGQTLFDLTSYVVDTHANHLAHQATDKEKKTQDIYGHGLEKPLADYDPTTQSWRMFGGIYLWGEYQLLATLPPSGMTVNGELFLQPAWEPITGETELLLWPTPTAHPETSNAKGQFKNPTLSDAVNQYPTMSASGMGNEGSRNKLQKLVDNGYLTNEEKRAMTAGNGGRLNPTWVEWLMGFPLGWTDLEDSETL